MEKRTPAYDLEAIKRAFSSVGKLRITRMAQLSARTLGLRDHDMVQAIQSLSRSNFYKSMTAYTDSHTWQDVYHAHFGGRALYIKFMKDELGHLILSFKEK